MDDIKKLAQLVRYYSLVTTSTAGSGHLTSSLSAADLMSVLFFGGFLKYDIKNPDFPGNDRIIFSKGHASSLFYSLWAAAGAISEEELLTYRKFGSPLEGHPTMEFKFTEAPTGSLGQGLSIGVGLALAAKTDKQFYKTFVLLGDSEMAEGQNWEAAEIASYYKLNNLIAIVDVNRLGQSRETMFGHDLGEYKKKFMAFGWDALTIDGHDYSEIAHAYTLALASHEKPVVIIAKTLKGKGIRKVEDKEGFHGKALPHDEMGDAAKSLGEIDRSIRGAIAKPHSLNEDGFKSSKRATSNVAEYKIGDLIATRKAYGETLANLIHLQPSLVVLDAEVSNSTYSEIFRKKHPERYFEMFIAEQNMVSVAVGLARRGKLPFVSTFAAFFTRAHDQIRMAAYAKANIKFVGSHAGVSIGEDGASQMAVEDIAMFRSLQNSVVLYPSDAISTIKLTELSAMHNGLVYIRTTRMETQVIYHEKEQFEIGGSKVLRESAKDKLTVIGAGVTLHEALEAYKTLKDENIEIRVIDLYSIKPIDKATLEKAADETNAILVVEDHRPEGGIAEAVRSALVGSKTPVHSLAVTKMPRSGKPEELLEYEQISASAIVNRVRELLI